MTPKQVIARADVEFLHGVPVHPTERGAGAIISALDKAGFSIVPKESPMPPRLLSMAAAVFVGYSATLPSPPWWPAWGMALLWMLCGMNLTFAIVPPKENN